MCWCRLRGMGWGGVGVRLRGEVVGLLAVVPWTFKNWVDGGRGMQVALSILLSMLCRTGLRKI